MCLAFRSTHTAPDRHGHRRGGVLPAFVGREGIASEPRAQVDRALTVLAPAALVAGAIVAFVPGATWLLFAFGWMLFPAFGQLVGGVVDLARPAAFRVAAALNDERTRREIEAAARVAASLVVAAAARFVLDRVLEPATVSLERVVRRTAGPPDAVGATGATAPHRPFGQERSTPGDHVTYV